MLVADQPIKDESEDKLGHAYFSQVLGRAINAYKGEKGEKNKDSIAIGLYGTWGSGKTSIINMALEHIRELQKEKDEKERDVIIQFNPWNYSDQNQLIAQFFGQLSIALEEHGLDNKAKEIVPLIRKYAIPFVIKPLASIALHSQGLGKYAEIVTQACQLPSDTSEDRGSQPEDPDTIKCELQKLLLNIPAKIIIVIDDIDRLNDIEVRQVFQLVKSLGDFHNTVYLLAFDRQTVAKALDKAQEHSGSKYLEKIVQIPLEVPYASKQKIELLLTEGIGQAFGNIVVAHRFDIHRWSSIYDGGLKYLFNNVRDVKRYVNCMHLRVGVIGHYGNLTNPVDLIVMTALQLFLPEIYSDIKNNEELLTRKPDDDGRQAYDKIMKKAIDLIKDKELLIEEKQLQFLLEQLFPPINS